MGDPLNTLTDEQIITVLTNAPKIVDRPHRSKLESTSGPVFKDGGDSSDSDGGDSDGGNADS